MALGAVLAAALTDHSAHPYMLAVAGVDMLLQPGTGTRYGIPIDTIRLTQRGPGGTSELTFDVEDSALAVGFTKGAAVLFRDVANDYSLFAGFVIGWTPRPWQPGGRTVEVRCQGVEAILDWAKVGAFTVTAGSAVDSAIQQAVGNVITGTAAPLRAFAGSGNQQGTHDGPIGGLYAAVTDPSADLTIATGTTLREAIRRICDASTLGSFGASNQISGLLFTVDYDYGLRVWVDTAAGTLRTPSDWTNFSVHTDQPSSAFVAATQFDYTIDATTPSGVVVVGAAGAYVVVSDGTGSPGNVNTFTDSTLTTTAQMTSAGLSYLNQFVQPARGSFDLEDKATAATVFPGSLVTIIAPEFDLASVAFRVSEIGRTFYGTRQDWHVVFGGMKPSFASLVRRMTRDTLS